jgi:hypothetical protein
MSNRTEAHITTAPVIRPLTYAEQAGHPPFDWNAFLDRALAGDVKPSGAEHEFASGLAQSWVTCACGNQCIAIPRSALTGMPNDDELQILGSDFFDDIRRGHWRSAKSILAAIEARSAALIAALTEPKP